MSAAHINTPLTTEAFYDFVAEVKQTNGYTVPEYFAFRIGDAFAFSEQANKAGIFAVLYQVLDLGNCFDENSKRITCIEMNHFQIKEALRLLEAFMYEGGVHENIDMLLRGMYATSTSETSVSLLMLPFGLDQNAIEDPAVKAAFQAFTL